MGGYAWVTLATNDSYSLGALVVANSLKRVGTKHDSVVLITPGVTPLMREKLAAAFSLVQEVNVLDSKDQANLALLARPELGVTFTKLHCWKLTQFDKCVFIDADTLIVRNCDELFEREELSAAPDVGWPDCFNSGVFVFKPSLETFESITKFAVEKGSFDGGDQGLLNMYFHDWAWKDIDKHLPFIYNMCSTATYSYLPAFKQFGEDVKIIHFIGATKPWLQYFDTMTGIVQPPRNCAHLQPLLQLWWNIFCDLVHPQLSPNMAGLAGALAQITLGQPRSAEQIAFEEHMRKQSWEQGQIDFMGRDSFDNIWKKICETLSQAPQRQTTPPKESVESEIIDITKETALLSLESQPVQKAEEEPLPSEKISESVTEQRVPAEVTESKPVDSKDVVNPILAAIQANVDQLCTELASNLIERAVPEQGTPEKFDVANKSTEPPAGDIDICSLPAASTDRIIKDLQEESDKCQLSVINPVPIQVAESVLQTEPKESVSEVPKPVEQVISSSVDIVQEAVVTRAEILAQATGLAPSSDLENGGLEEGQAVAPLLPETRRVSLKSDSLPKEQLEDAQLINIPAESVDQEAEKRETQVPLQEIKSENLPQDLEVKPVEIGPEVPKIQELKPEVSDQKLVESKEIVLDVTEKELKVEAAPDQKLESKDSQSEVVVQKSESKDSQSEIVDQKAESKELVPEAMEKELKSEIVVEKSESKELKPEEPIIEKDLKSEVSEQKTESKESVPEAVTEQKTEPKESVPEVVTEQKTESKESIPEVVTEQTLKSEISDQTSKSKEPAVAEVLEQKLESGIQEQQKSESKELAVDVAATQELKLEEEDASKKLETKPKDLALEIPTRTLEKTTEEAVVAGEVSTGKEESVEAPIAAKELDIPPTPTVTEATPPTSPPIQQEDIEKVSKKTTKKVIKKTSSEDTADTAEAEGGESSGKKGTKKVVKKVVKRKDSDEGQESEKTKKSVKATKKVTKPAQALGPDTNVPETPPPSSSSEVPVPPKRKAKGSTTKSSKPDSES